MADPELRYDVSASHREDLLDEALDESFPASDPVSVSLPDRVADEPGDPLRPE